MRRAFCFFSLCFLLFIACTKKETNGFVVEGKIKNAAPDLVFLEEAPIGGAQPVMVDSARIEKDGSFKLSVLAKEENLYLIYYAQQRNPIATIINDSKKITIEADLQNATQMYTVNGSEASQAMVDFLSKSNTQLSSIYNLSVRVDSLRKQAATDSVVQLAVASRDAVAAEYKNYATQLINSTKSPALAVFALGSYQSYAGNPALSLPQFTEPQVVTIINATAVKFPEHTGLATLKTIMQAQKQAQQAPAAISLLNKPAPDFSLPDVKGNPVSLSSFKGKYVLVDFWASWCGPCRAENPNVVNAYQQFKNKNFTILGVSLDREKGAWSKAIEDDGLTWTHVSDLKFWNSIVVPMYGIDGIPFNVLVDPKGVVIAERLTGEALESKLREVL